MTDNEIKKALECCTNKDRKYCTNCPLKNEFVCVNQLASEALDLINRQKAELQKVKAELKETTEKFNCQQYVYTDLSDIIREKNAEIEKLQSDNSSMQSTLAKMSMGVAEARAEAIKEYKDKVKSTLWHIPQHHFTQLAVEECLDKVNKEMVGDM